MYTCWKYHAWIWETFKDTRFTGFVKLILSSIYCLDYSLGPVYNMQVSNIKKIMHLLDTIKFINWTHAKKADSVVLRTIIRQNSLLSH